MKFSNGNKYLACTTRACSIYIMRIKDGVLEESLKVNENHKKDVNSLEFDMSDTKY